MANCDFSQQNVERQRKNFDAFVTLCLEYLLLLHGVRVGRRYLYLQFRPP